MTTKWEFTCVYGNIRRSKGELKDDMSDPSLIWESKNEWGKSVWDTIIEMGSNGWELVSVTPIIEDNANASYTRLLLYTFKKQLE